MKLALVLIVVFVATLSVAIALAGTPPVDPPPPLPVPCLGDCVPRSQYTALRRLAAKRLAGWDRANRQLIRARGILRHSPTFQEAIGLAVVVYGHAEIRRKCYCESTGRRYAHNTSGASGICQFLPSTFASTPFHGFSIYSMYANALAAGWMHEQGRGGEWNCR